MENDKYDIYQEIKTPQHPNKTRVARKYDSYTQELLMLMMIEDVESEPIVGPIGPRNLKRCYFGRRHAFITFDFVMSEIKLNYNRVQWKVCHWSKNDFCQF